MVERARLEIVLRGNTYGGSNPSLCAIVAARHISQQGKRFLALFALMPAAPLPKKSLQSKSFLGALFAPNRANSRFGLFALTLNFFCKENEGFEGRQASFSLRRSADSTADKTADTRCFPCASAKGANPSLCATKKRQTLVCLFLWRELITEKGSRDEQGEVNCFFAGFFSY